MYLISAKGYENANVHYLRIRETGEIWGKYERLWKWFRC